MPGTGANLFAAALRALCAVAERNLPLLAHTDTAFHGPDLNAAGLAIDYFAPWLRILEHGHADGSLAPVAEPRRFAVLVTDTVLSSYVHLRAHHRRYGWTPEAARYAVIGPVANGYLPRPGPHAGGHHDVQFPRSAGTRMNRAVWYLAAVLLARVRQGLPVGAWH